MSSVAPKIAAPPTLPAAALLSSWPSWLAPPPDWKPPPGWVPPASWQPPPWWTPPPSWQPPPGWRPGGGTPASGPTIGAPSILPPSVLGANPFPTRPPAPPAPATTRPPAPPVATTLAPGGAGPFKKAVCTWYTSYPACCYDKKAPQGECRDYNGCKWAGAFAAFDGKKSPEWVRDNDIVAFYEAPESNNRKVWARKYANRKLLLRDPSSGKQMVVTIVDTCSDRDCNGCCSKNARRAGGYLVDLEVNTARRFYAPGKIKDMTTVEWKLLD